MVEAENLIDEIQCRPALYDKSLSDYSVKSIKEALWMEVAGALIEDWEDLSEMERTLKSKELQFKWKHIRDNYRRELQGQKKKTGPRRRRRKYKFFEKLEFLKEHLHELKKKPKERKVKEVPLVDTDDDGNTETQIIIAEDLDSLPTMNRPPPRNTYARMNYTQTVDTPSDTNHRKRKRRISMDEDSMKLSTIKEQLMETDEDRTFCLSLVNSLKKMSYSTKLNAKIDILKVIRQHTVPQPYDSPAYTFEDTFEYSDT